MNDLYLIKRFIYGDDRDECGGHYEILGAVIAKSRESAIWAAAIAKIATRQELESAVFSIERMETLDKDSTIFKVIEY